MHANTKIIKFALAFAADLELRGELGRYQCMFPRHAHNFHTTFNYIHAICGQLDGEKLLQQQIKLRPRASAKQLVNQDDITIQENYNGNSISDIQAKQLVNQDDLTSQKIEDVTSFSDP